MKVDLGRLCIRVPHKDIPKETLEYFIDEVLKLDSKTIECLGKYSYFHNFTLYGRFYLSSIYEIYYFDYIYQVTTEELEEICSMHKVLGLSANKYIHNKILEEVSKNT